MPASRSRRRLSGHRFLITMVASSALLLTAPIASAAGPRACSADCVEVFTPPVAAGPFGVTAGPLGSEWFSLGSQVARVDRRGAIHTEDVPSANPNLGWLTASESGVIWFAERGTSKLGSIEPSGATREYQLPGAGPQGIVLPGDGNVYVAEQFSGDIARVDPATGHVTTFAVPGGGDPLGLALGPDGALWFTERAAAMVGRMSLAGHFTQWPLTPGAFPNRIVAGPDGALWFTELLGQKVGRITTAGELTEYSVPGGPVGITVGKDARLYVVLFQAAKVDRISLGGQVTGSWTLPGALGPLQVATGFGLDLWVTDNTANLVFRLTPYDTGG